jgi:hypothetical protein
MFGDPLFAPALETGSGPVSTTALEVSVQMCLEG